MDEYYSLKFFNFLNILFRKIYDVMLHSQNPVLMKYFLYINNFFINIYII